MFATRRIGLPVAALVFMAAVLAANPPTAGATPDTVTAGSIFLFKDVNFGGAQVSFSTSQREFSGLWYDGKTIRLQNSVSSMQNLSTHSVEMRDIGTACTGAEYVAMPNSVDSTFTDNGFNDKASCLIFR